jgi:hypothetical protein
MNDLGESKRAMESEELNKFMSRLRPDFDRETLDLRRCTLTTTALEIALWHRQKFGHLKKLIVYSVQGVSNAVLYKARRQNLQVLVLRHTDRGAVFKQAKSRPPPTHYCEVCEGSREHKTSKCPEVWCQGPKLEYCHECPNFREHNAKQCARLWSHQCGS